jgi:hypothetical protein
MAYTQAEINAALVAELAARPNVPRESLTAYAQSTYGLTQAQINAAYDALNASSTAVNTGGTTVTTGGTNVSTGGTNVVTGGTNTGLLTQNQNLSLTNQVKTYSDEEVRKALKDLSFLDPYASIKDIISAAQAYGISKDRVIKNISSFTYNSTIVDKLSKQILAQNTTGTWKGDVKPETAARYMADDLAKSGVTDISQVGKSFLGIINKETGEKLVSGYGERTKGNLWSGSYEGAGNTGFGVQFTESGAPIFYTEGASSSTLKKDLIKAAIAAAVVFGIPGTEALSGIFGPGQAALTATEAAGLGLTAAEATAAGFTAAELTAAGYTAAEVAAAGATTARV